VDLPNDRVAVGGGETGKTKIRPASRSFPAP
jgi:hypothetical protein